VGTRHDTGGLGVLEALAIGLQVISTKQNGAAEIMTDGVGGFVLESRTVALLVERMREMMDAQAGGRMVEAALKLRPKLSQEEHVNRLLEIYESIRAGSMRGAKR